MIATVPTLALYDPHPSHPDAWHRVTAPGGYEWWYFDAEDPQTGTQIVAILFQGFVFHPQYLRRDARYRSSPTRNAPATPDEYPCAYFVIYEQGKPLAQFMTQYPPDAFAAGMDRPDVTLGGNRMWRDGDRLRLQLSGTPWRLGARGPRLLTDQLLAAQFRFDAAHPTQPAERIFLSSALAGGAAHHWVLANPWCGVAGTIDIAGRHITFNGRGYHDHNYGTAPLHLGLRRWFWGRVLFDDRTGCVFHVAQPADRSLPDEVHLLQIDESGAGAVAVKNPWVHWKFGTGALMQYPSELRLDDAVVLSNPVPIDVTPFYLRLAYRAQCFGRCGTAFCELATPNRLRWPILGRMIELSIDKRSLAAQSGSNATAAAGG